MMLQTTYERPVKATLVVRTEHNEEWEATDADIARFGLVDRNVFVDAQIELERRLGVDLSEYEHDAPVGKGTLWEAVSLALYLVRALVASKHDDSPHPDYADDVCRLGALLTGQPAPDDDG